jgi:phosphatidylserine decarboxylase
MSQYEKTEYSCFNDFFTRKILDEKRPVIEDDNILVSPCDARLSAYKINRDSCFSIKHSIYKISDLIENSTKSPDYSDGVCLVFRLCVDDYHRYRYIDDGNIVENRHIKGRLHTVRPIAVNKYPVFTQNSREYSIINTKNFGTIAQVEVGAMMIGKIKNHKRSGSSKRGVEKGMFLYGGSTIVILFQRDKIILPEEYFVTTQKGGETRVLCGQELGRKLNVSDHENDSHQR